MTTVTGEEALGRVREALGDRAAAVELSHGHVEVTASPENLVEVVQTLRDHDELRCRFFTFLSGVDRSELGADDAGGHRELEVLIHLYSPQHVLHVNVHVPMPLEGAVCPSISGVFGGAEWHERETWEMFGIAFSGHPRLVHLYLPEDFEGNPLRKSFRLPSRIVKQWPGAKDPEEAAAGGR